MVLRRAFTYSVLSVCALCVLLALPTFGQRITGDIAGNVTDSSGAVVPNATVTAENLGTNEQRNISTTESGGYRIPDLAIGQYKVTVTAQGFKTSVQNVQVLSGALIHADFRLQIGQRTETVEVEGAAHLCIHDPRRLLHLARGPLEQQLVVDLEDQAGLHPRVGQRRVAVQHREPGEPPSAAFLPRPTPFPMFAVPRRVGR